jgi:hypothetical protein
MATNTTPSRPTPTPSDQWSASYLMAGGLLMSVAGLWSVLTGITAVLHDGLYVTAPEYTYSFNTTAWGWVHIIVGGVLVLVGVAAIQGMSWARNVGIAVASISMILNFGFIPYYPVWSILIIALDVVVILALVAYPRRA